jgi:uncharacterized protein (DUF1800 family)
LASLVLPCNQRAFAEQAATPATPPPDIRTAAHFLENATFGPTAADISWLRHIGFDRWLTDQFAMPESPMFDHHDGNQVRSQLMLNMANGPDQLRQRTIFALSQTIVVSANKTGSGPELIPWVRLLSRNAFGNYRTLLAEVSISPTMGKYLDLAYSRKATATSAPNENYARELLQLFSIGLWELNQDGSLRRDAQNQPIPTYDQDDIREFARALTGWTFPTQPGNTPANSNPQYFVGWMEPRVQTHDTGAKTLFGGTTLSAGQSASADMQAVIDNVFQHANVPPFVATRLIRSLVTSNPSPAYVRRVADAFVNNGQSVRGDLRAVLTAILTDPEALRFTASEAGRLKDPVLQVVGLGRALNATVTDPSQYLWVFNNLSQRVLTPATVFSFYSPIGTLNGRPDLFAPEFQIYPAALAVQRANFIYSILAGWYPTAFVVDLAPFQAVANNVTTLVNKVDHALMFGRMSAELRQHLTTATTAVPASDTRERALGALFLAAISSEYAVSTDRDGAGIATLQLPPPVPPSVGGGGGAGGGGGGGGGGGSMGAPAPMPPAAPPSTPVAGSAFTLSGSATGSVLSLSWENPAGTMAVWLDVSGSIVASVPLGAAGSFQHPNVPPGTYSFVLRAVGARGPIAASNTVTLTFGGPGAASGAGGAPGSACAASPQTPVNVQSARNGQFVSLTWQPSPAGDRPTGYLVDVTGSFVGGFRTPAPALSGTVGPGTYIVRVLAQNACGTSAATLPMVVTVP